MARKALLALAAVVFIAITYTLFSTEHGLALPDASSLPRPPSPSFDASALGSELRDYLRIKTVRGNERAAADYLKSLLDKEGIESRLYILPDHPERAALVAELPGARADGGIVLANHMDVVEANASEWTHDPFAADVSDGQLYGRGAIDMKGMGVIELAAFVQLKRAGAKLSRKVMFLALPDEESGGDLGAHWMLDNHQDVFKGYEYMWQEGGVITSGVIGPDVQLVNLQYAEKGILWLRATATGASGHGSTPPPRYASADLLAFLDDVRAMEHGDTVTDEVAQFLYQLGSLRPMPDRFVLQRSRNPFLGPLLERGLAQNRHLEAMVTNTRSITGLDVKNAGINVISDKAEATIDVRLLPGMTPEVYLAKLEALAKPHGVTLEVVHSQPPTQSPLDDPFFRTIGAVAARDTTAHTVAPFMSPGGTDSSAFRRAGMKCYGLVPIVLDQAALDGIHGKDEHVRVADVATGATVVYEVLFAMEGT